ncbi:uncharacterized protein LOC143254301 [Tachypleus tridentatus]|uniref:uncharacterized protein LOC143254301 n=1 Tax=Tachypleus tridentatus TaxID=6853 RepID=UPI003FCFA936
MAKARTPVLKHDRTNIEEEVNTRMASLSLKTTNLKKDTRDKTNMSSKTSTSSSDEKPEQRSAGLQLESWKKGQVLSKTKFGSRSFTERGTQKKRPQLSASDPTWEMLRLRHSPSGGCGPQRKGPSTPSSSSSHSSGGARFHTSSYRPRLHSDSFTEQGYLLPRGLRDQHAAHKCGWSESDSGSGVSPAEGQTSPSLPDEGAAAPSSVCTLDLSKKSDKKISKVKRRKNSKFEVFVPLCDVQQSLKKGEVIEGVLKMNPRDYKDSYISAPIMLGQSDGHLYWRHK